MKLSILLLPALLLPITVAHFTFTHLLVNNTETSAWQYVRDVAPGTDPQYGTIPNNPDWNKTLPQYNLSSPDIRCGREAWKPSPNTETADVVAGSGIGFRLGRNWEPGLRPVIQHVGPGHVYLARVPEGVGIGDWDGDGEWFKVAYVGPVNDTVWGLLWKSDFNFTLPPTTPPGPYLVRVEMFYPNTNNKSPGTQFYVNCAQINVIGPGGGVFKPDDFARFPGAYTKKTPGIWMDVTSFGVGLFRNLTNYPVVGPEVWRG